MSNGEPTQRWKVRPTSGGEWLFIDSLTDLRDMLDHDNDGDAFTLVSVWMTDEQVEALGEFGGW